MAHIIIDRRRSSKTKSTENRQRFLKRVKNQVRDSIRDVIRDGSIDDIINNKQKKIKIPGKGLTQPKFRHSNKGGVKDFVHPGNKEFNQGDKHARPPEEGGSGGRKGSNEDSDESDEFAFHLSSEEFLDLFFEDLELPDMVKKDIAKVDEFENRRAGFSVDGNPSRLNILQSLKRAKGRKIGLRSLKNKKLKRLLAELAAMELTDENQPRIDELNDEINALKRKIKAIPFLDDMDLRYNRWEKVPIPTTQAVMFGIMDCSGSMGEWEKEMAKRFFMVMLMFLHHNYERVEIVWIRHTTVGSEVDEDTFFHSRETGGTVVSSALQVQKDIIEERYPLEQWNIFGCQISDGDNWMTDNVTASDLMSEYILPKSQYFAYIEVDQYTSDKPSDLWPAYHKLSTQFKQFAMAKIHDVSEIYPVFRTLFEKKEV